MNNGPFLCEVHIKEAALFCLCNSSPVFTCPECTPKHEGHEAYPIAQYQLFESIGRDTAELKRRNALYQCCRIFIERVMEREAAVQYQAKTMMNTVGQTYYLWLEGNYRCFESLLSTLREESALLLTRSNYRVSSVTQKILEKLNPLDPEIGNRSVSVPEVETLNHLQDRCQEACSRMSKVWQEDYEEELLQSITSPHQSKKRERSASFIEGEDAQLTLKLEEATQQLQRLQTDFQTQAQHNASLQKENMALNKLTKSQASQLKEAESMLDRILNEVDQTQRRNSKLEAKLKKYEFVSNPPIEFQGAIPDYTTPESRAALTKFGPYSGKYEEEMLNKLGPVMEKVGIYIGQWNTRNQKHGYGRLLYKNGERYEGQWRNGDRTGKGRFICANGEVYVRDFVANKREGFGNCYFPDGSEYSAAWKNGQKHGIGSLKAGKDSESPGKRYIGEFINDKKSGIGAEFETDGKMYVGSWKSGEKNGKGLNGSPPDQMYIGDYIDGEPSGTGSYLYSNGDVYTGEWKGGHRSGQGRLSHRGTSQEGAWEDGEPQGKKQAES